MEWLKDKKNQPIVIAIASVVIVGVLVFVYFSYIKAPSTPDQSAATPGVTAGAPPAVDPSTLPPGSAPPAAAPAASPAAPGTPAAAPAAATATATAGVAPAAGKNAQVASITPMETWRGDPFLPIGYKAKKVAHVTAPIRDFPFMTLPGVSISRTLKREKPEIQQPSRRMAGILQNDRIYAIIESNGESHVYQPGDYTIPDRLAMVQRIEPDKVVLKTVDDKPRYITVRMAASAHTSNAAAPTVTNSAPSNYPQMRPRGGGAVAPGLAAPPP